MHVDASERKVDDRRVLVLDKVVFGESLGVEDQIGRKLGKLVSLELISKFLKQARTPGVSVDRVL